MDDFIEDYLAHIAAVIKSRIDLHANNQSDRHLSVNKSGSINSAYSLDEKISDSSSSDGILTSMELIQWMRKNLGMLNDFSIKVFLQQMANYGFLERIDGNPILFPYHHEEEENNNNNHLGHKNLGKNSKIGNLSLEYCFPLPFVTECSPTVEALITSISACLSDINISINECGFLLMTRRCWPDPYISKYVLERLVYSILEWICNEDEKLLIIAREYTSSQIKLPGVRDEMEESSNSKQRESYIPNAAGGGAYLISRRMLKEKYVESWLSTIHDMDEELFCDIVFEQIGRMYENQSQQEEFDDDNLVRHVHTIYCMYIK